MTKILKLADEADFPALIHDIAAVIRAGGIVVLPTDTVYGIAASAFDEAAIQRLYAVKERDPKKSIAVLLGDAAQAHRIAADFPAAAQALAQRFWPGGLTLIVAKKAGLPANLSANEKIGIRIPDHAFVRQLILETGPLATTSANHSGEPPANALTDLPAELLAQTDLALDGGAAWIGVASTVVDCTESPVRILREGSIPAERIRAAVEGV